VCKELIKYLIIPDKCTGCLACIKVCPQEAISGELKKVHVLNQEKCIKCGACFEVCQFDAIKIE
jgi:ferredoxin